jgi:hypothetical protein
MLPKSFIVSAVKAFVSLLIRILLESTSTKREIGIG